jgi:hypothetical protein
VSVEAISWALNLAPVPADRGGQPSTACKFVGLANHAGPDGTGAFPSVATLIRYTGLSERTVRCLTGCRPSASSHRATRASWRPGSSWPTAARKGWDLNLSLARHDLDAAAVGVFEGPAGPGAGH